MSAPMSRKLVLAMPLFLLLSLAAGACSQEPPAGENQAETATTDNNAAPSEETAAAPPPDDKENPVVIITTNKGSIEVELDAEKAPISVANFLSYIDDEAYDGTVFHRVIKGFMIQGGGFGTDKQQKTTKPPIKNEADNGLLNDRGTLAMARTGVVDSATSQFFVNTVDNAFLNFKAPTTQGFGYAVFGRVTSGMDVVDAIESSATSKQGGAFQDAPTEAVVIESIRRKG